jgi:hypothetical protein
MIAREFFIRDSIKMYERTDVIWRLSAAQILILIFAFAICELHISLIGYLPDGSDIWTVDFEQCLISFKARINGE